MAQPPTPTRPADAAPGAARTSADDAAPAPPTTSSTSAGSGAGAASETPSALSSRELTSIAKGAATTPASEADETHTPAGTRLDVEFDVEVESRDGTAEDGGRANPDATSPPAATPAGPIPSEANAVSPQLASELEMLLASDGPVAECDADAEPSDPARTRARTDACSSVPDLGLQVAAPSDGAGSPHTRDGAVTFDTLVLAVAGLTLLAWSIGSLVAGASPRLTMLGVVAANLAFAGALLRRSASS